MDAEQNFIANFVYEIPFLRNRNDLAGRVLGGWQFSGITTFQTGLPIDPLNTDQAGVGSTVRQRPQVKTSPVLDRGNRTVSKWFDPAGYALPAIGTFATTSRNFISKPGVNNWDLSLYKTFKLQERFNLQLRADAFNPWNHTEFDIVGFSYSTPSTFGRVTAAKNARSLMVGLRLQW